MGVVVGHVHPALLAGGHRVSLRVPCGDARRPEQGHRRRGKVDAVPLAALKQEVLHKVLPLRQAGRGEGVHALGRQGAGDLLGQHQGGAVTGREAVAHRQHQVVVQQVLLQGLPQAVRQLGVMLVDKAVVGFQRVGQVLLLRAEVPDQAGGDGPSLHLLQGEGLPLGAGHLLGEGLHKFPHAGGRHHLFPTGKLSRCQQGAGIGVGHGGRGPAGIGHHKIGPAPGLHLIAAGAAEKPGGLEKAVLHILHGFRVHTLCGQPIGKVQAPGAGPHILHRKGVGDGGAGGGVIAEAFLEQVRQGLGMCAVQQLFQLGLVLLGKALPAMAGVHAAGKAL